MNALRHGNQPSGRPDFDRGFVHAMGLAGRRLRVDSRLVEPGDVFAAMSGHHADGRRFIDAAVAAGAVAVLWDPVGIEPPHISIPNEAVPDLAWRLGWIAAEMAGHPGRPLWTVGITGTNGKTTCSHWLASGLTRAGRRCGRIGTLGYGIETLAPLTNTTPDGAVLHTILGELRRDGAEAVAMEVSSHGLAQGRVHGVEFDVAVFTNLTRDHLDFHGSLEAYGAAKSRLFHWDELQYAVVVTNQTFGAQLADSIDRSRTEVVTVGHHGDVRPEGVRADAEGLYFRLASPWGSAEVHAPVLGLFNADNISCVLASMLVSGVPLDVAAAAAADFLPVDGRMQVLRLAGGPSVVVDYAHTPDALEHALASLRPSLGEHGRLHCVFGCGGDRDAGKRPLMGEVAARLADRVVLTSDNPRSEDPAAILEDIRSGITSHCEWLVEPDRARAITLAVAAAHAGDIVLLAGKGHETTQEIAGQKYPFSDVVHARLALDGWQGGAA
ncbi:MAG: UDP-N-acetylmuramoyl-L-alanyl-D-glutamate--2,6-diaminopimelate ligase [Burkholderiales bacterium]|nr:UDP-N-acetylmuramoyl-L-alanyl-D-glutamate--2,6-diaminopimelate ligase [Burkholderiales bacterium]